MKTRFFKWHEGNKSTSGNYVLSPRRHVHERTGTQTHSINELDVLS